jgi:cell division protein ZapA
MSQGQSGTKAVYEVVIAGVPLKLRSGHDPKMVKQLVSFVDNKVQQALPATKSGSVQNAALLAALNLAEELFELKSKAVGQLEKVEKKAQKTLSELESALPPRVALDN